MQITTNNLANNMYIYTYIYYIYVYIYIYACYPRTPQCTHTLHMYMYSSINIYVNIYTYTERGIWLCADCKLPICLVVNMLKTICSSHNTTLSVSKLAQATNRPARQSRASKVLPTTAPDVPPMSVRH